MKRKERGRYKDTKMGKGRGGMKKGDISVSDWKNYKNKIEYRLLHATSNPKTNFEKDLPTR